MINQLANAIREKHTKTAQFYQFDPVGHSKFYLSALEWVLDEIEKIQSKGNNGWISVDDMLPKEFEKVLLFGKYLNEETFQEVGHYIPEFAKQFEKQGCFSIRGIVTHWQPLPQPPKE